ncbi:hypothetical protein KXV32_004660 [Aspergillus fumigatus]|nr:hypothetical protein KXV32_004660 [Aspergillus fumigatus]
MLLPWLVGYGDIRILVTVYGLTPIARDDVLRHDLLDPTQTLSSYPLARPVTFVNWGTPFDPKANLLGVFQINDTATDHPITLDTIKFQRRLPPSREDLVEIPAESSMERTITIPHVPLEEGHEYAVQAKGIWHGIWECARNQVTDAQLQELDQRGEFESERALFKVTQ